MTSEQTELARQALGLPNREARSYRNYYYYVGEHAAWEAMVAAGLARKRRLPLSGGHLVYWLTKPAAEAALSKGERLDPEDFPARMADNANPK